MPGWIIRKDDGGEADHSGVSTMCSYSPPPSEPAMEKHKSTKDHIAALALMHASFFLSRFSSLSGDRRRHGVRRHDRSSLNRRRFFRIPL